VIFDPHGDYLGFYENRAKLPPDTEVKLFYPMMKVSEENITVVSDLLAKMGRKMTEAQHDFFNKIVTETKVADGTKASDYILELITRAENTAAKIARKDKDDDAEDSPKKFGATTVNAVKRSLSFVLSALKQMEQNNKVLCERLKDDYQFHEMPDPKRDPEDSCTDGYVHGYMYYAPINSTGPFSIMFATYDKGEGWALAGFYDNAIFDAHEAPFRSEVLLARAGQLKSLNKEKSLGGKYKDASVSRIVQLLRDEAQHYRWRVSRKNVHVHPTQYPLSIPKSLTRRFGAYFTRPTELTKGEWDSLISFASDFTDKKPQDDYSDGGDTEFPEGRECEVKHKARERNRKLVVQAKARFKSKHGKLFCEACNFNFKTVYGNVGDGFIEAHHTIPVSELEPGAKTRVSDLALVCSNCHRILHRRRPWLTIPALRKLLERTKR
jgi:hypothetical protein